MYEYVSNDPINFYDISGLQESDCSKNSTEEYKDALKRMEALLNQLIENNKNYEQLKKNEQAVVPYLWKPPTFWEGLDQSVPIMLDYTSMVATAFGAYPIAGGLTGVSAFWTAKNEGLFSGEVGVSIAFAAAGNLGPIHFRIPVAIGQVIYDLF